jgi:hypothetical protein
MKNRGLSFPHVLWGVFIGIALAYVGLMVWLLTAK